MGSRGSVLASCLALGQATLPPPRFLHLQHRKGTRACLTAHQALLGHHGVKEIRWKECGNELLPRDARWHRARPSHSAGGGEEVLVGHPATSAAGTRRGRTGSPLPPPLLLALQRHRPSEPHLPPSNAQTPRHVPSRQCFGAGIHQRGRAALPVASENLPYRLALVPRSCALGGSFPPRLHPTALLLAQVTPSQLRLNALKRALMAWRGNRVANGGGALGSKAPGGKSCSGCSPCVPWRPRHPSC